MYDEGKRITEEKAIPGAVKHLDESLKGLWEIVERLEKKLEPVLRTEPPKEVPKGSLSEIPCKLGQELNSIARHIDSIRERIREEIIERLEL